MIIIVPIKVVRLIIQYNFIFVRFLQIQLPNNWMKGRILVRGDFEWCTAEITFIQAWFLKRCKMQVFRYLQFRVTCDLMILTIRRNSTSYRFEYSYTFWSIPNLLVLRNYTPLKKGYATSTPQITIIYVRLKSK